MSDKANLSRRIPSSILKELSECGLTWTVERGKRHLHIRINGRLAAIFPINGGSDMSPSGWKNIRSCIRRKVVSELANY